MTKSFKTENNKSNVKKVMEIEAGKILSEQKFKMVSIKNKRKQNPY